MECSGLKEEMNLEEAVDVIITTHDLWKCVLTASGSKKEELWKEKHVTKAVNTIMDLKRTIEKKTIERKFFMNLQKK